MKFGTVLLCLCAGVACLGNVSAITYYYLDDHCGSTIDMSLDNEIRLKTTAFGSYRSDWTCQVTIESSFGYRMMAYFKDMSIEYSSSCTNDYLQMLDGTSRYSPSISSKKKFCGLSTPSTVYTTTSNDLTLYFKSDNSISYSGFDIIITEYETGICYSWEHNCNNGRCIDESLVCNGYNPCGDNSDCSVAIGLIVGPVIGGATFLVVMIVVIILVRRRRYARMVQAYPAPPIATTVTSATSTASGTYGVQSGSYNTQYGYQAPVQPYQQLPNNGGQYPAYPPPYKPQELGMPAAH